MEFNAESFRTGFGKVIEMVDKIKATVKTAADEIVPIFKQNTLTQQSALAWESLQEDWNAKVVPVYNVLLKNFEQSEKVTNILADYKAQLSGETQSSTFDEIEDSEINALDC